VGRLLTVAQAWNNYYWLVERYWRESCVNYEFTLKRRNHAQKTKSRSKDEITLFNVGISIKSVKSRSKDEITLKRRNHAQKTKSRFTLDFEQSDVY
jgi:hypothetical protein